MIGPVQERVPTPSRSARVHAGFGNVSRFLALLAGAYLGAEVLIFDSGLYARFLDPDLSATGYVERIFHSEANRPPSGRKDVLVAGNSRMAEGFSAKIANEPVPGDGYWFVNFGVNGAGDRVWYYLVRDLDPYRSRYAAITIPIDDYDDPDDYEDVADRASEMPLVANRLRVSDIVPYTLSFTTWKSRRQVLRGLLFEGPTYSHDFRLFFEHPLRRLEWVGDLDAHGPKKRYDYTGMEGSLAGLQVDWVHQQVTFPPGISEARQRDYASQFFSRPPLLGRNRAFEVRWLGALVDLYRDSKTRIIVFQAPRSPAARPVPLAQLPWTIVDELGKRPWVTVIDRKTFEDLERPELFADHVHLNAAGRKLFSPRLADIVKQTLARQ